jgi:hypothetical protein
MLARFVEPVTKARMRLLGQGNEAKGPYGPRRLRALYKSEGLRRYALQYCQEGDAKWKPLSCASHDRGPHWCVMVGNLEKVRALLQNDPELLLSESTFCSQPLHHARRADTYPETRLLPPGAALLDRYPPHFSTAVSRARFFFRGRRYEKLAMSMAEDGDRVGHIFMAETEVMADGEPLLLRPEEAALFYELARLKSILTESRGDESQKSLKESTSEQFVRTKPRRHSHFYFHIATW